MNPQNETPAGLYRIQTVSRMTGVPTAVLRAWEKRYGVPTPSRTDTSYRMYTETDVAMVRRLNELRETGLAASEAARVVLREHAAPLISSTLTQGAVEHLLDATRRMDGAAIDEILASTVTYGNAADAFERVVAPTMVAVGEAWQQGMMSEAQEHLLSEHVTYVLQNWLALARPASSLGTAVIGCFADELHTIPAYGLALRWASRGLAPIVLGARTTPTAMRVAIERLRPRAVGLSLTMRATAYHTAILPEYAEACGRVPWVLGGAGTGSFAEAVVELGGSLWPHDAEAQNALFASITRGTQKGAFAK